MSAGWRLAPELDAFVIDHDVAPVRDTWPATSGETYLELCAVDLDDPHAISAFVERYGTLELRYSDRGAIGYREMFGFYMHDGWEPVAKALDAERERAVSEADGSVAAISPLSEFRYGARCMRDLVTAARAVRGELDPPLNREIWQSPVWDAQPEVPHEDYPWKDNRAPAILLDSYLMDALEGFSPVIRTRALDDEYAQPMLASDVTLWQILCLELFNHLAASTGYKTCANERCGRLFVKHEGRSEHGQHRTTGVRFCCNRCSKAQANRDYRARKAAAT